MAKFKVDPRIVGDILLLVGTSFTTYYMLSYAMNMMGDETKTDSKKKANVVMQKLLNKRPDLNITIDKYEQLILSSVIMPEDIKTSFEDIGGLEDIIEELKESVLYPLTCPQLYNYHASLLQAPKGVLFYGPPGCGKTMLAKAIAAESSAIFINIRMSTIMDKWFGESNKLVAAIFSLARKLQPCIIFIDEIDSFLRERKSSDHEVTANLKTEFMTMWDGLTSDGQIMVLGATNRPNDIDDAILRRMPKRFPVPMPNTEQRRRILEITLKDARLDPDFDINLVVEKTQGMSGSDLREACRNAAWNATRDTIKKNIEMKKKAESENGETLEPAKQNLDKSNEVLTGRPIKTADFFTKTAAETSLPRNIVQEIPNNLD